MNILIVNQPLNNRGDESAHKALIRALLQKIPDAKISVLWVDANQNSINQFSIKDKRVTYINIHAGKYFYKFITPVMKRDAYFMWHFSRTISKVKSIYKNSDYVLCAPGGICMGGFQNWSHLFYLKLAQRMKIPVAYVGRSFGPFPIATDDNKKFKEISLDLLHYFSYTSFRDMKSIQLANKMNLNYFSTVDTAFLDMPQEIVPPNIKRKIGDNYIVFVPNLLIWHYAYRKYTKETILNFFVTIANILLEKIPDRNIVMLPQTFNFGNYENDDIHFFKDVAKVCNSSRVIVVPDSYSSDFQQTIIRGASGLIGARYHSVVFAINNNIPFVAFNYEHKIAGLLETLGLQDCMVPIIDIFDSDITVKNAIDSFTEKISCWHQNENARKKAKDIANSAFDELVKLLK